TEAWQHQEEVQKTLNELLQALDSFASTAAIKGEAKSILEEQKGLHEETKDPKKNPPLGKNKDFTEKEEARIRKLSEDQRSIEERTDNLLNQMQQVRDKRREEEDNDTANQLDRAIQKANEGNITGSMKDAREQIQQNKTQDAAKSQREAIDQLKNVVKELEDRRAADLDKLAKKLREKQEQLEKLAQEQDRLQKKVQEAKKIADPKAREEELKRLARRQQELKEQTEELARELSRMRQDRASQAAGQAASRMEQALKQLQRGQDAEEEQDEALERLDEAQREVERTKEETEEELAREQAAKAAEEIKRLKQRHEALMAEASRIGRTVLQEKAWRGRMGPEIKRLGANQKQLGEETANLAEKKLADAQVFGRMLQKAADTMTRAGGKFVQRAKEANEEQGFENTTRAEEAENLQKEALRRLDQLLEALKQEPGAAMRPAGGGGGGGQGGAGGGAGGDGIPPVVQYKLLRAMQSEINNKTEAFARRHPD